MTDTPMSIPERIEELANRINVHQISDAQSSSELLSIAADLRAHDASVGDVAGQIKGLRVVSSALKEDNDTMQDGIRMDQAASTIEAQASEIARLKEDNTNILANYNKDVLQRMKEFLDRAETAESRVTSIEAENAVLRSQVRHARDCTRLEAHADEMGWRCSCGADEALSTLSDRATKLLDVVKAARKPNWDIAIKVIGDTGRDTSVLRTLRDALASLDGDKP